MKHIRWAVVAAALLAVAGTVWARLQGDGSSRTAAAPAPEMRQRMGEFRRFRERHRHGFQLRDTVLALGRLAEAGDGSLRPEAARQVSAVIARVRKEPSLSEEQAKQALKELKAPLSPRELTEVGKLTRQMRERRSGPGRVARGGGRQGAHGDGGARRPAFDPAMMKEFNPLALPADGRAMPRGGQRLLEAIQAIEGRAGRERERTGSTPPALQTRRA